MNIGKAVGLTCMMFGLSVAGLLADTHTLESSDGKKIEAKIISVTDTTAKIHVGKKSMDVSMTRFSEATQTYLKEWQKANVSYSFAFTKSPKMIARIGGVGDVHHYGYQIDIESRVGIPLKKLKVRYQIYNTVGEMKTGTKDVTQLDARGEINFLTVAGARTKYKRLYRWDNYNARAGKIGNHLGGIWIRIYDEHDNMVYEWKSTITKMKVTDWTLGGGE